MSRPVSTYRVQLTPDFGFAEVAKIAPYLRDLGVSHVYLSPVLQAVPGSLHGYDVVDHSRIRQEFGGAQGFREMAGVLAAHDLAVVVDIVPNHMNTANAQFLSVLEQGAASPYADWFDIEWREGKVIVHRFADDLPQSEHYTVVDWREGPGYRRFFDVSSLIGLRVEDPAVFFATHEVIFWLLDEGLVEGLRIDHPDGLADPAATSTCSGTGAAASGRWWRRSSSATSGCLTTGPATAPPVTTCSTGSTGCSSTRRAGSRWWSCSPR
ncbi:alpha-amylase family glycosyl hydrolase [Nonomuraea recticatena]|uniref:alpha-amylase family glycosyl hydrolase n=1 Tax=Nonomuraea recticatena TaxID=46178 RepID=UPI0036121EAF